LYSAWKCKLHVLCVPRYNEVVKARHLRCQAYGDLLSEKKKNVYFCRFTFSSEHFGFISQGFSARLSSCFSPFCTSWDTWEDTYFEQVYAIFATKKATNPTLSLWWWNNFDLYCLMTVRKRKWDLVPHHTAIATNYPCRKVFLYNIDWPLTKKIKFQLLDLVLENIHSVIIVKQTATSKRK
jgi:hypothetical protein